MIATQGGNHKAMPLSDFASVLTASFGSGVTRYRYHIVGTQRAEDFGASACNS